MNVIRFLKNRPGESDMINQARRLIENDGLLWEKDFSEILVSLDSNYNVVGTAQIRGNLIKEVCIDKTLRGQGLSEQLVTEAVSHFRTLGIYNYFVFTKPETAPMFKSMGLRVLSSVEGSAVFLEGGTGISDYLNSLECPKASVENEDSDKEKEYDCGAIVLNCNPMTKGHHWLIERAAADCRRLYIFIVTTDRSAFSTAQRSAIVRKQLESRPEIAVNPTGPYMVSDYLFPAYFTGPNNKSSVQAELDARLFGGIIAPSLGIKARFVGSEPFCPITREYNSAMKRVFPEYKIDFHEFERITSQENVISASAVRRALGMGKSPEELSDLLVPASLEFLKTEPGNSVIQKIKNQHANAEKDLYIKELRS